MKYLPYLTLILLLISCTSPEVAPADELEIEHVYVDSSDTSSNGNHGEPPVEIVSDNLEEIAEIAPKVYPTIPTSDTEVQVEDVAVYVLNRIKSGNYEELYAVTGESFAISPNVSVDPMLKLKRNQLSEFWWNGTPQNVLEINITAPSGQPEVHSSSSYFSQYIWDKDYSQADLYINEYITRSTQVNNLKTAFPNCEVVEALHETDEEFGWSALNLIFEKIDGNYYLVGLIHDQHTI